MGEAAWLAPKRERSTITLNMSSRIKSLPDERCDNDGNSGKISGAKAAKSNQASGVALEAVAHAICS
ncbi:hypothetical protein GCM10017612_18450 [Novosphingobium resinovorum]|nr:hypothetical protein GCM10017612_18450 [Novosphingobium resinovorum]